ncbi:hypothetical protein BJL90_00255 [Clostridium formicaceticum]|uniref:Membrane-associated sensor domain-containing protein n=1 Tax=Clostridium formicaceticum TaxID=1497 RepID=A0ABN4T195_9CLOT|nr:hypothetical protein BJL90_00255 [Clostridium formicaceticum]
MNIIKNSIQFLKVSTKEIFVLILLLMGLAYLSFKNFLLFHTISEIIPITISMIITLIAVNTYKFKGNNSLSFLGMAYFFVGSFDLIHTLTYKGMGFSLIMTPMFQPNYGLWRDIWKVHLY